VVNERPELKLSLVVPVYNALPYLREMLDSLAGQGLDATQFEVIAIDDGSTDGSGDVLDEYARQHQNVRVIHQDNSGWPGGPRNVGLRASTAKWVFFADADDLLAPGALSRIVDFAEQHEPDIIIPRLTPLGRRAFPTAIYEETRVDAELVDVFDTLFSQKLYRREMLAANDIWFPEGKVRLEDGIFNAHAYVHAKRISILSGGDYYFLRAREDGRQLSREELEPAAYTSSVSEICQIARDHLGYSAAADADQIITDVYRRKCLHIYQPGRFTGYDDATRSEWVAAHQTFAWRFISDAMEQRLASPFRERSYFVRRGDSAGLLALAEVEAKPAITASLNAVRWSDDDVEVEMEASIAGRLALPRQLVCEIRRRDGEGGSAFPVVRRAPDAPEYGQSAQYYGAFPFQSIDALLPGTYDVHLTSLSGTERFSARLRWDQRAALPPTRTGFRMYATKHGHVSVQKNEMPLRRALGRVMDTLRLRR
jgi:glycosyltransferase involved in cell wall biosynthesis